MRTLEEKFDCIVVGAGPAGTTAALVLAKAGLSVAVLERGEFPGSKNMFGGIFYTTILQEVMPDFWEKAPLERPITIKKLAALSSDDSVTVEIRGNRFKSHPFNHNYTVMRAKFDNWFASCAEEAGAFIASGMVVDDVIYENGKISGVATRTDKNTPKEEGYLKADCLIIADGANSILARKLKLRNSFKSSQFVLGVKEIIELDTKTIEDRFGLSSENEGTAIEFFGEVTKGLMGSGFIYTNKSTISLGLGVNLFAMQENGLYLPELIDAFKAHPSVAPYIKDGKTIEYSAHLIPEYGYNNLPQLYSDNVLLAGDAAGLVNFSLFHEGTNLAMASGKMAAETVIEARKKGNYSKETLSLYKTKLEESFVLKDLKKFKDFAPMLHKNPQFIKVYPALFAKLANEYFVMDSCPKAEKQKKLINFVKKEAGLVKLASDLFKAKGGIL